MPLRDDSETSSDEEGNEGEGGEGSGSGAGPSGRSVRSPPAKPRSPDGSPPIVVDDTRDKNGNGGKDSPLVEEVVPHSTIIKGDDGTIYGSYDSQFPFLTSRKKTIGLNPLIYTSDVNFDDFSLVGIDDPKLEDINTIIAIAARGVLSKALKMQIQGKDDCIDDVFCPSLEKWNVTSTITKQGNSALKPVHLKSSIPRRPLLAALPGLSYTKDGWVGKQGYNIQAIRGTISPKTRVLVQPTNLYSKRIRIPKMKARIALENLSESFMKKPMSKAKLARLRSGGKARGGKSSSAN